MQEEGLKPLLPSVLAFLLLGFVVFEQRVVLVGFYKLLTDRLGDIDLLCKLGAMGYGFHEPMLFLTGTRHSALLDVVKEGEEPKPLSTVLHRHGYGFHRFDRFRILGLGLQGLLHALELR